MTLIEQAIAGDPGEQDEPALTLCPRCGRAVGYMGFASEHTCAPEPSPDCIAREA